MTLFIYYKLLDLGVDVFIADFQPAIYATILSQGCIYFWSGLIQAVPLGLHATYNVV